jgi:hypothetical protein
MSHASKESMATSVMTMFSRFFLFLDISSRHNVAFFTMREWEKPKKYAIDRSRQKRNTYP